MKEEVTIKEKRIEWAIHILAWLVYIGAASLFIYELLPKFNKQLIIIWYIAGLFIDILIFYFFYAWSIPRWLGKGKYLLFIISLSLLCISYPFVKFYMDGWLKAFFNHNEPFFIPAKDVFSKANYIPRVSFVLFLLLMSGTGKFTFDWFRNLRLKNELIKERLTSELAFLKSQLNPHFLFNTLNNIYSLAYKQDPNTHVVVLKLSELMRYMLYESNDDFVPLNNEITCLQNFIDLHQIRLKEKDFISFELRGELKKQEIAPMLLIPFVENAIKHGNIQRANPVSILLDISQPNTIYFEVKNNYKENDESQLDKVGGVGLENIHKRLELLYHKRHKLEIVKENNLYCAKLWIKE